MSITPFIHELAFVDLPAEVVHQSKRCLIDLLGVALAGSRTDLSRIARRFAIAQMGAGAQPSRILFDGRVTSRAPPDVAALLFHGGAISAAPALLSQSVAGNFPPGRPSPWSARPGRVLVGPALFPVIAGLSMSGADSD
jgi:hypothetical protein